jgi:hypothetical protein
LDGSIFDPTRALVALIVVVAALGSVDAALRRPFWFDEILTLAVATQPSPAAIWEALEQGVDGNPPTFHLIEKAFGSVASGSVASGFSRKFLSPELMYRLPSIVAFALTLVAVFLFVRHVAGAWSGTAAAAMLLPTQLFTVHAVDARPYALVACAVHGRRADALASDGHASPIGTDRFDWLPSHLAARGLLPSGDTALLIAVKGGDAELTRLLIAGGAKVDLRRNGSWDEETPRSRGSPAAATRAKAREGLVVLPRILTWP